MTDPVCDSKMHWFRQPVFDGEACVCGKTYYRAETSYHHQAEDEDEPKPYNPSTDLLNSPWAPLIESTLLGGGGFGGFGGGSSGGGGASGHW